MSLPEIKSQPVRKSIHWLVGLLVVGWIILSTGVLFIASEFYSPQAFEQAFFGVALASAVGYFILFTGHGLKMIPVILLAGILQFGGCLHFVGVRSAHSNPVRHQCRHQLEQIGKFLSDHHDRHGTYPPAYVVDESGQPLYSWMVPMLPWIEERHLYEEMKLDEPWNSPHNQRFTNTTLHFFQCPVRRPYLYKENNHVGYLPVVGPETAWPGAVGRPLSEFTDGPENTILLFEVAALDIPWAAPPTLDLDTAIERFTKRDPHGPSSRHHPANISVLMADGSTRSLPGDIPPETLRALLTVNGGETVVLPEPAPESSLP